MIVSVLNADTLSLWAKNLAIQAYFANFHPIFPIVHAPSFRPHSQNGLLLLSICSVGSLFLGSNRATAHGVNIFERLHKALLSSVRPLVSVPFPPLPR